jgi:stage V sporulation protein AC
VGVDATRYGRWVTRAGPGQDLAGAVLRAFWVGGLVCAAGQAVETLFLGTGLTPKLASAPVAVVMVFFGVALTAAGGYDRLTGYAGMGGALPITGFANAMAAPAMEWRTEGLVLGLGARLFTVAGPVLVYGFTAAWALALLRLGLDTAGLWPGGPGSA